MTRTIRGGGSFTVPALVLLGGLTAGEAVGTAFLFAGVLRLIAAPFYLRGKKIQAAYLWLLLQGAVPGLLAGIGLLRLLSRDATSPVVILALGVLLAASSGVTFIRRMQNPSFARKNPRWLPWLALPIGVESGFSSAGAGALGTVLLLNYSEMTPAQVVGTDLLFGLVLAVIGQRLPLEFRLDQPPDSGSASSRRCSGCFVWLLAGAEGSRKQTEARRCRGGCLCWIATGMDRKPLTRR
jgi:uncharacterized protein